MAIKRKADYQGFVEHIQYLREHRPANCKPWWPQFVFHYTDLQNAVSILGHRCIYSRQAADEAGLMNNENASTRVIENTSQYIKRHARFYFRPRTPTQYRNEGFRAEQDLKQDSHCPVPVFFLLDAVDVLTRSDTVFCDGSAYYDRALLGNAKQFAELPFEMIYHDSSFTAQERDIIVPHRHAEVLVPDKLKLDKSILRYIVCRSPAEKATLLESLGIWDRIDWGELITCSPRLLLFFGKWTYIVEATLASDQAYFVFNENSESKGPFDLKVEFLETATGETYSWEEAGSQEIKKNRLTLMLPKLQQPAGYQCTFWIDGHVAFKGSYIEEQQLPF